MSLIVDGVTVASVTTGSATGSHVALTTSAQTYSGTFTATTTGSVSVQFLFTLQYPISPNYGNDDIAVAHLKAVAA